ncbi:MAG: immunoglobulin domain-containing protein [Prosthecobacter sp.]
MKTPRILFLSALAGLACVALTSVYLASKPKHTEAQSSLSDSKPAETSAFRESLAARIKTEKKVAKAKSKTQFPLAFKLLATLPKPYIKPLPAGVDPSTQPLHKDVLSSTFIERASLPNLASLKKGQKIGLPLPDGSSYDGQVNLVKSSTGRGVRVGGAVMPEGEGSFSMAQNGTNMSGMIRFPSINRGYVIESLNDGRVLMQEYRLDALACLGMKRQDGDFGAQALALQGAPPVQQGVIPLLDTRPTASAVIYIDFDGETVTDTDWNNGNPIVAVAPTFNGLPLTSTHITSVVEAVAEDFAPFNVSITTDLARYTAAPIGKRMRCIVTPTDPITNGAAGGVAYLDSWSEADINFDSDVPCWCFGMYAPASMALVISHEVGHTFGLSHDGTATLEYYSGHTSLVTSWGPIMGAPYNRTVTQWSNGQYNGADNYENDVAIISNTTNAIGFMPDAPGSTTGSALVSDTLNGSLNINEILLDQNDEDWFLINSYNGGITLTAVPTAVEENVDITLLLLDSTLSTVAISSPSGNRGATLSTTLTAGAHYIVVVPSGDGSLTTGYNNYGSIGAYRISGSYTPVPSTPQIITQPASIAAVDGTTVTLSVNAIGSGGLAYQWIKDTGLNPGTVPGATGPTLSLTSMSDAKTGTYRVRVTNASNPSLLVFSNPAVVSIAFKPKITVQPAIPLVITSGNPYTFNVTATGTGPLIYSWEKIAKPVNIPVGTNSPSFNISNVVLADAGSYRVRVTNVTGTIVTSNTVILKVKSPPVIMTQPPANLVIAQAATGILKVVVGGEAPFFYEWFKVNGLTETSVGKTATLTVKGDGTGPGTYRVKVANALSAPGTVVSTDCIVEVDSKPTVVTPPIGGTHEAGVNVTLSVVAGGTAIGRTYQWYKDGKIVVGAVADTLAFTPVKWADRGSYLVEVKNRVGAIKSKAAVLIIRSKPIILTEPVSFVGATKGAAAFSVVAGGDSPLTYQWFKGGVSMSPAGKTAKLSLTALTGTMAAPYFCRVSNGHAGGSTDSATVTLTVEDQPKVTAIVATNLDILAKPNKVAVNGSITITPTVTGTPPFTYQWMKTGKPIVGAVSPALTLNPAQLIDSGSYTVVVRNRTPLSATSAALAIGVLIPPTVTAPPSDVQIVQGYPGTLSVGASGSPTLKYQWQRIENLGAGDVTSNLMGKTTSSLSFLKPAIGDAGRYRCLITNDVGSALSPIATLSVLPTPPATVLSFLPTRGQAGEKILLTGNNLEYTKSVKIGGKTATFTIVSPTQLLITTPGAVTPSPATFPIQVISDAGTFESSTNYEVFTKTINDAIIDANIVSGTAFIYRGSNTGFTVEGTESFWLEHSAWLWWTAPRTGQYRISIISQFDSAMQRYSGTPTALGASTSSDFILSSGESQTFSAVAGQSFVFGFGGSTYGLSTLTEGNYQVNLIALSLSIPPLQDFESAEGFVADQPLAGQGDWEQEGDVSAARVVSGTDSQSVQLGGGTSADAEPVVLWNSNATAPAGSAEVVASVKMKIDRPEDGSSTDRFGWTISDRNRKPIAALWVDARDGQMYCTDAAGTESKLTQKLQSGSEHKIEFILNRESGLLDATIDGLPLVSDLALPVDSDFGDISAVWIPSKDGSPHASMNFDDLAVIYSKEEQAVSAP